MTRGSRGTVFFTPQEKLDMEPFSYARADQADNVGAGDACVAGRLVGLVLHGPMDKTLRVANHLGVFAASQPGATPRLSDAMVDLIR